MNKEKIRAIVVKVVLAFCAVFVVMTIIGLLVPVGNANPSSDNIEFTPGISLLNFDNSRSYEDYEMSEVDPSRAKKISSYDGFVIEWNDNGEDITFDAVIEEAGKYQIAVDYLSLQTTVANISINVLVNGNGYNIAYVYGFCYGNSELCNNDKTAPY